MSNLARRKPSSRQSSQITQSQSTHLSAELAGATTPANDGNDSPNSLATQTKASRPGLVAPVPDQAAFNGAATTLQTQIKDTASTIDNLTGAIVDAVNTKADMSGHAIAAAVMGAPQRAFNTASDVLASGGGGVDASHFQQWLDGL